MLAFDAIANSNVPTGNLIGKSTKVDMFFDVNPTQTMDAGDSLPLAAASRIAT